MKTYIDSEIEISYDTIFHEPQHEEFHGHHWVEGGQEIIIKSVRLMIDEDPLEIPVNNLSKKQYAYLVDKILI